MIKGDIMTLNIDKLLNREHDLSELKKQNCTVTPNGVKFTRDLQGFLPELMEKFYEERKEWKGKMIQYQIENE